MAYYGNKVSNTWRVAVFLVIYTSQVSVTLGQITVGLPVIPRTTYYQESGSPPTAWVLRTNQLPAEHFVHRVSFYIQTDFSGTFSGNILIWERMVNIPGLSYRLLYKQHVQYRNTSGEQVVDIYYGRRVDSNSFIGWSFSQSQGPISMEYASTPLNGTHVIYTNDIDLVETKIYNSSFNKPVFFSFQAVVSTSFTGVGAKGVKGEEGMQGFKGEKGVAGSPGPQGQQGVSGDPGPRGQKGDKGLPGLKGNQGSKGQKGELGEAGSVGGTGSKGIKGIKGEAGPKGQQGPTGPQGETGIKGVKGDKGISGDQGLKGIKGVSGGKGEQGTSGDKGFIGPQGPKGIQGAKGDVGPKGAAGPGDKGAVGSKGPVGGRGITGDKGVRGNAGDQGLKGEKGDIGPPGSTGVSGESQGPPGPQGPQGVLGDKGPKGEKGSKGDSDLTGLPGEKGDTGSQGYKGTRGIKGDIGSKGVIGGSGPKGDKGGFGPTGIKGDKGDIGEKGDNGVPGIIGPTGPPGNTGPTGDPGVTGQPGSQGITGEVGDQGYKGQPGDEGPPGPTGAPGVQGDVGPKGNRGPKGEMANVINYCALQNGRCQHVCVDLFNSSMCTCYSGYSLQPDRRSCEDIDECLSSPCEYDCVNTPGSFICTCPDGYTVDSHVTTRCQNWELVFKATTGAPFGVTTLYMSGGTLNENNMAAKQMNNDVAEHYKSDIVNTWEEQNVQRVKIGLYNNGSEIAHVIFDGRDSTKTSWFNKSRVLQSSYNISHLTSQAFGYSIDGSLGRPSQSFNIFLFGGLCGMGVVSVADSALPGSPCDIDTQNLTTVYASTGTGSVSANGNLYAIVDCMGIFVERDNACIMNNGGCQHKCHNMGQQKMCSCNDGYELNIDDVTCSDVDECSRFMPCAHNCTNQLGGYLCSCREGFFSDNNDCFDINECDSPSVCGDRVCINTFGSYVCLQAVLVTHSQRGVTAGIIQAPDIVHGNPDVILDAENLSISKAVLEMKLGILGIGFTFFIVIFCITKFLIKSRNRLKLEEENLADLSKGLHHVHVFKDDSTSNKQTYVSGYAAGGENSGYATDDINKLSLSLRGLSLDDVL